MKNMVEELTQLVSFKETTEVGDIVLIIAKEPQMLVYARINGLERDTGRREEWWHVDMTMLSLPLQRITWTLRTEQMTGKEIFTMGGEERFVKAISFSNHAAKISSLHKPEAKTTKLKRVK